jgi:cephalosporin-C deacetylase-like acetyl esterase
MKNIVCSVLCFVLVLGSFPQVAAQGVASANGTTLSPVIADPDWVFLAPDTVRVQFRVESRQGFSGSARLCLKVTTDDYVPVREMSVGLPAGVQTITSQAFDLTGVAPGFYRCTAWVESAGKELVKTSFQVGYEPEKIVSPRDARPDFEAFWAETRRQLDQVPMEARTESMPQYDGARQIYHVQMKSFGNVMIEGFYAVPKGGGRYPALIGFMGYGSEPYIPSPNGNADFCELILSVRGQGIQKAKNPYGDWIVWGLERKEDYYYRGAFMDLIRGIDFLYSRPEVDTSKIVAEGGSQGGAFTLVACALDHRIKAAAPTIPFLSDYRDYFRIVPWPYRSFQTYMSRNPGRSWEDIYQLLTYFDVKNFCGLIRCPIFMSVGLQDDVCPPHTNFSGYNLITAPKKYLVAPEQAHGVPRSWYATRMAFFREVLGLKQ